MQYESLTGKTLVFFAQDRLFVDTESGNHFVPGLRIPIVDNYETALRAAQTVANDVLKQHAPCSVQEDYRGENAISTILVCSSRPAYALLTMFNKHLAEQDAATESLANAMNLGGHADQQDFADHGLPASSDCRVGGDID